jgi:hypothetical protein
VSVLSRQSENALYREALATFEASDLYDHSDATGFIRLFGLPYRVSGPAGSDTPPRGNPNPERPGSVADATTMKGNGRQPEIAGSDLPARSEETVRL